MDDRKERLTISVARFLFVASSGVLVLASIVLILLAMAYLRGGHPPASGIVVVLILMVVGPIAAAAAVTGGLQAKRGDLKANVYFILCGVSGAFALFAGTLLFLKLVLGATI